MMTDPKESARWMRQERERRGWSTTDLANRARAVASATGDPIKLSQQLVSMFENGKAKQVPRWLRFVEQAFRDADDGTERMPDLPNADGALAYLSVKVLPTFAGMGGGGTGEGDRVMALLPRALVEDELKAKPDDLLLIDVRGNSMEPDFQHGDQILIDVRDRNPIQPGPFAIWDGDGYVVKNVERAPGRRGFYRIFSTNGRYSDAEHDEEAISIMGRPVWFARRL